MENQMLRKQILTTHQIMSGHGTAEKDIVAVATVLVSSEDPRHPIDYAFDGQRGPGASRWIAAQSGEQTLILAFDAPQTIRKILVEVEEPEISRTQEMAVSISQDRGADLSRTHTSGVQLQQPFVSGPDLAPLGITVSRSAKAHHDILPLIESDITFRYEDGSQQLLQVLMKIREVPAG
jgi:hypothetical protein